MRAPSLAPALGAALATSPAPPGGHSRPLPPPPNHLIRQQLVARCADLSAPLFPAFPTCISLNLLNFSWQPA
eukprot:10706678-Heterocapsa_arctica.AAC.1